MRAGWIGGFVAAEGTFTRHRPSNTFTFAVALGATDRTTCELLQAFFGVGGISDSTRRQSHYDDESCYRVRSLCALVEVIVPFMDEHLLPSHKRTQYEAWRVELLEHWEHDAKRRRPCTFLACAEPQRAKGLCRRHYFDAYRR